MGVVATADDTAAVEYAAGIGVEPLIVSDRVLAAASDTTSPASPVLVLAVPDTPTLRRHRTVVLLDVADPGNVGTAIRTAAALGWDVAVGGTSADPWGPKALRSSTGATLGCRVARIDDPADIVREGLVPVALVVRGGISPDAVRRAISDATPALLIGSEAHGLRSSVVAVAHHRLTIPMMDEVDSLNAATAAAIAMYALQ